LRGREGKMTLRLEEEGGKDDASFGDRGRRRMTLCFEEEGGKDDASFGGGGRRNMTTSRSGTDTRNVEGSKQRSMRFVLKF
jgi:hypothetical protein